MKFGIMCIFGKNFARKKFSKQRITIEESNGIEEMTTEASVREGDCLSEAVMEEHNEVRETTANEPTDAQEITAIGENCLPKTVAEENFGTIEGTVAKLVAENSGLSEAVAEQVDEMVTTASHMPIPRLSAEEELKLMKRCKICMKANISIPKGELMNVYRKELKRLRQRGSREDRFKDRKRKHEISDTTGLNLICRNIAKK